MRVFKALGSRTSEVIFDTFLLGFGLFIIFPHFQYVYNYLPEPRTIIKYGGALMGDYWQNTTPYILFFVIIAIWASVKLLRLKQERDDRKNESSEAREAHSEDTQKIIDAIENLGKMLSAKIDALGDKIDGKPKQ